MRPGTLPHHRTCGFPHPAVGPSRVPPSQARRLVTPNTPTGWGPSAFGLSLVSPGWRPQLSRPAASFVLSSPVPAPRLALFGPSALRIGTPFCSCVPRSLLWPLLTSHRLSAAGSPRVNVCSFCSRLWALPNVASGSWGSRVGSHTRPRHPASLPICVPSVERWPATLSRRLLAETTWRFGYGWHHKPPAGTFHPARADTCRAHERRFTTGLGCW